MTLQRSVLHSTSSGRDFRERFGWESPGVYSEVATEYRAATEAAAVHDTSYAGRLKATGADALDLLNRLSTNQVLTLEPGQRKRLIHIIKRLIPVPKLFQSSRN